MKAAELLNGEWETGDGLLAYTAKDYEADKEKKEDNRKLSPNSDSVYDAAVPSAPLPSELTPLNGTILHHSQGNHNATYDSAQDEPYIFIEILEVCDR